MKNKIFKLGLFSLLSLGALATVSATFTNKTSIVKNEVSLNTTKKFTTNPTTGNREWILEQDEEINEDMFSDEPIDLYLQGHILKITGDHYLKKRFGDLNIYDYKGEEPEVKPIHKFKVNENYHYWELDEDNGDIEVSGGVIYAAGHSTTQPMITTTSASINLYGGTVCGSGTAAFNIYYNSALFTMYGGAIRGNSHYSGQRDWVTGAAVCVRNYDHDPSFVMNGGVISDNYAYGPGAFGGAAVGMIYHSHFTMNGGQIINNITDASESEADAYGGAIYADATGSYGTSSITINGGEISNNKIIAGSKDAYGGAIGIRSIDSPVTINGGIISNNTLSSESGKTYGGGIYGYNLQIHGGEISNNIADYGGGIYACDDGTHTTSLEVDEDKELLITNNTANIKGGGMIIESPTNNISGKVIIKNNNPPENDVTDNSANLHLYKSMTVTGPLDGSDIHFSSEPPTGESLKIMDYVKSGSARVNEFFHYDGGDDKYIDFDDDGNIEVVQIPEGEAHTIVAEPCDPSEGSIVAK